MKKNIVLLIVLVFAINVNSQVTSIVPLNSLRADINTNGVYYKDLNDLLLPYVGTWEGIVNNKKYTFEFQKFTQKLIGSVNAYYCYEDEIKGRFKVVDLATNQTLFDNLSVTNYDQMSILGLSLNNGNFDFWFQDTNPDNCKNSAQFTLQKIEYQPIKLKYCYFKYDDYDSGNCIINNQEILPMFLPKVDLILTKI